MNPDSPMDPDKYQEAWQAQSSQTRVTVDADLLLKEVQRNQREFRATILRRDVVEVGVGLLLLPYWFYKGLTSSLPWTWWLTVPAILWSIGFFLVDRSRHPQRPSDPAEPLRKCVENSLTQVEHQIWLLRNVFWWYLLPFTISILAFFAHMTWRASKTWVEALAGGGLLFLFLVTLYSFLDYINQRCVRLQLVPRRQELFALLASLGGDDSTEEQTAMSRVESSNVLWRWLIVSVVCLVILIVIALASGKGDSSDDGAPRSDGPAGDRQRNVERKSVRRNSFLSEVFPKRSPFAAVRWQEYQPEVKLGEEWIRLVALDDIPASEIVAFSQRTYDDLWRKRLEEDLVELLTRMGHPPQDKVTLVVQSLTSSETQVREDVPMTYANRQAIKAAAQARGNSEP